MKFKNNLLKQLVSDYIAELTPIYNKEEAAQMVYWLTEDFFGISRTGMILNPEKKLSESEMLTLHFAVKSLKSHVPVQYIIGKVAFLNLSLKVTRAVLIPRPETEQLVDWIMQVETTPSLKILDIGTGSGCIALALKQGLPDASVWGYDQSSEALAVAMQNAKSNGLEVLFFKADIFQAKIDELEPMDVITSNPPYVLQSEKCVMQANVLDYEPHTALFVPDDTPLLYYEGILKQAKRLLRSGGRIYFEINETKGREMVALLHSWDYEEVHLKHDLNGKPRFVSGVKQ
ncbi:MAG: peptide chain release factor N(5)-glutamine methyltransferase [Bacteroidetes bacterium]|nr:peptide chain release factor N(5)-glutamine methyltransferase [Bacteroidota bacterium]